MSNGFYPIPIHLRKHGFIKAQDGATKGATIGEDVIFAGDGLAGFHELGVSTGLVRGGKITINALDNTKIDIAEGDAIFIDHTNDRAKSLHFGPFVGVAITNIASQPVTYISIDSDGNVVQTPEELLNMQRRSMVELGIAVHTNNTNITVVNTLAAVVESTANQLHDFMEAIGPFNKSGNVYSAVGGNLQIKKTAGDIFRFGAAFDITPLDPHTIDQTAVNPITFRYRKRDSVEYSNTLNIDPNNYDLNGTLTAVQANRYTVQRIYMFQSGLTRIQYGQKEYQTLNDAVVEFEKEPFVTEENMEANGIFRAFLVVKQGATDLSNPLQAVFFPVSKFGAAQGGGGAVGYTTGEQVGYAYTASTTEASTSASIPVDNTIPQNTEGTEYTSLNTTYTPKFATSLLEIEVTIPLMSSLSTANNVIALFRDNGADAIAVALESVSSTIPNYTMQLKAVVPATSTAATTFKIRFGVSAGTMYILTRGGTSTFLTGKKAVMTVKEIYQ